MAQPFLSIVIPAYNEEARIAQTLDTVAAYAGSQDYSWEVVVADDGSVDGTAALVEAAAREHGEIRLVRLPHGGKGSAVRAGMLEASGEFRFLADADLSMPIEQVERFLPPRMTDFEVAIGSREAPGARRIGEPASRHAMGRAYNGMVQLLAVPGLSDTQCGFKCFAAGAAEVLFPLQRALGFGFDVEVLFLARRMGMRIQEVPIDWYFREGSKVKPVRDSFLMLRDLLSVRWNSARGRYGDLQPMPREPESTAPAAEETRDNRDSSG